MTIKIALPKYFILLGLPPLLLGLILSLALLAPPLAQAAGPVGTGTAASCTETALRTALAGGGLVTFNCGSAPVTITLTSVATVASHIDITQTTTISGGGLITLRGNGSARIFNLNTGGRALILDGLTVRGGQVSTSDNGGAAYVQNGAVLTVTNSTLFDNRAGFGGAIYISDNAANRVVIIKTAIISNSATNGDGGAIRNQPDVQAGEATLIVANSTLSQNFADKNGGALGIGDGTVLITNTTILNNSANRGGGIRRDAGNTFIKNTILAGNTAIISGPDCFGSGNLTSRGHSLIQSTANCSSPTLLGSDITGQSPLLGPLTNNGGPTLTHAPQLGSPIINNADSAACAAAPISNVDQRGIARPQGGGCDRGAVEATASLTLDKDTRTPSVAAGGVATYTITVRNSGIISVTSVIISDVLPSGFTYRPGSTSVQTVSATRTFFGDPIANSPLPVWSSWSIQPNGAVTITFSANVSSSVAAGTYDNTARTDSSETTLIDDDGTVGQDNDTPAGQDPEGDEDVTVLVLTPQLTIDKDTSTPLVVAGEVATYTIVVRNIGSAAATGVVVTDTLLPPGFTFKFNSSQIQVISATRTITTNPGLNSTTPVWRAWTIQPGGAVTITFGANVSASALASTYENTAQTDSSQTTPIDDDGAVDQDADTSPGQDPEADEDVTVFVLAAQLTIDKDTQTPLVMAGSVATYTIAVHNTGNFTATGVMISDPLPAGFTYRATSQISVISATRVITSNPNLNSPTPLWRTWTVRPGGAVTLTFSVNVSNSVAAGTYDNTARVDSNETNQVDDDGAVGQDADTPPGQDPEGDEDVTVEVPPVLGPQLTIDKSTSTPSVTAGGAATYRLVIRNTGTATATGVVVTDTLPAGFTYKNTASTVEISATRTSTVTPTAGSSLPPVWKSWTIRPNGAVTLTFNVDVSASLAAGTYHNSAQVDSLETNPVTYDGSATNEDVLVNSIIVEIKQIYIPLIVKSPESPGLIAPDLVVDSMIVASNNVQIVIRNQGTGPVTNEFWVDFYVNPNPPPTGVNQVWNDGRSAHGAVWGVTASALPSLEPGESLTLSLNGPYYRPELSNFPGSLNPGSQIAVFAQVDSANLNSIYGAVQETHEINGEPYNNIKNGGLVVLSTLSVTSQPVLPSGESQSANLPLRP